MCNNGGAMMIHSRKVFSMVGAMLLAWTTLPAYAVTFTLGNNPQADEQNVLYSASQTGTSITGLTNQTNTSVLFTSSETLQTTALGQANLTATDGAINNVMIAVPGRTYGDLILNPLVGVPGPQSVPATVSVLANNGTFTFDYNLTQGNNFLTILADSGQTITSTTITSSGLCRLAASSHFGSVGDGSAGAGYWHNARTYVIVTARERTCGTGVDAPPTGAVSRPGSGTPLALPEPFEMFLKPSCLCLETEKLSFSYLP
jgi:hypothetical protein